MSFNSNIYKKFIYLVFFCFFLTGINTGVGPLYLSEIAPTSLRGLCGTFNQLAITFGVLVAEIMGLDIALGTESLWPILVGMPCHIAIKIVTLD